jgi:acetyl esterase/lipase
MLVVTHRPELDPELRPVADAILQAMPVPTDLRDFSALRALDAAVSVTDSTIAERWGYRVESVTASRADGSALDLLVCWSAGAPAIGTGSGLVLLYFHGGGLVSGTSRTDLGWVLDLAAPFGAAVISVGYRLAPEHPAPAQSDDCLAAYRWVRALVGPEPCVVFIGASAGGGLAAGLSLRLRETAETPPSGQLLVAPMLDDRGTTASSRQFPGAVWDWNWNKAAWAAVLPDGVEACRTGW